MKTMKKMISGLFALVLVAGFAMNVNAQSDNKTITASANVLVAITVTAGDSLVFGNVSPGLSKTVTTTGDVVGSGKTGVEKAGTFNITKGANSDISLTWVLPKNLTGDGGNLDVNFSDLGTGDVATQLGLLTGGTDFSGTDINYSYTPTAGIKNLKDVDGVFKATSIKATIGGTVVPLPEQAQGEYTGTITLTATYN
jgi:hypothetical protein